MLLLVIVGFGFDQPETEANKAPLLGGGGSDKS